LLAKMRLLCGVAGMLAETIGIDGNPLVQERLGELLTYCELVRAGLRAVETDCVATDAGLVRTSETTYLRNLAAMTATRVGEILEQVGTSGLVMTPSERDMARPELAPFINRYFRGKDVTATERIQLFKLAWDLVGDAFGSRQALYERLHAGDPARNLALTYQRYDKEPLRAYVRRLLADPT